MEFAQVRSHFGLKPNGPAFAQVKASDFLTEGGSKMKITTSLFVFWSLLLGVRFAEGASQQQCDRACQYRAGLKRVEANVADHSKNGPQDQSCPAAGIRTQRLAKIQEGSLLSAEGILMQIQTAVKAEAEPALKDQSRCGSCEQVNVVSPLTTSRPKAPSYNRTCDGRPTETVRGEFASEQAAKSFVEQALRGENRDGERLYAACPDPCSFNVYNAYTQVGSKIRINLVVQCGQPKGGLFAKYEFGGGYVHEWTCRQK